MKKSSRTGKLRPPPVRKAAAKKVSVQPKAASRPSRNARPGKAQGQTELAQVVAQLASNCRDSRACRRAAGRSVAAMFTCARCNSTRARG